MRNTTVSVNQTSPLPYTCFDSYPGSFIGFSTTAFQFFIILPIHTWVLWLSTSDIRKGGSLATSDIFTVSLSVLELLAVIFFVFILVAFVLDYQNIIQIFILFSGSNMVGRPLMNSLICVERYMAVAHPAMYRNPAFVKHRYIGSGLVWLLILPYGGSVAFSFPDPPIAAYTLSLSVSLSVITACSLGVLKILLRPSPGETQKEGMHHQKKRAFVIITGILVCFTFPYGLDLLVVSMKKYITYDTFCILVGSNMWFLQTCSLIQPFLYLSKLGKFSCIQKSSQ